MAASSTTWNDFTIFGGTLSTKVLSSPLKPGGSPDVADATLNFRGWLAKVRNDPVTHGLLDAPVNYADAARRLLDTFFPNGDKPLRFSTGAPSPGKLGQAVIKPVIVPFGTLPGQTLAIADGPSALGYLFSVVQAPPNLNLTWQTYFLPLTILYSWCVYLTYVKAQPNGPIDILAVPRMACVMYLPRPDGATPYFFLGHSKARASVNEAEFAKDKLDNILCLTHRAGLIQKAAQMNGGTALPVPATVRARMVQTVFEFLPGKTSNEPLVEDFLEPVFDNFVSFQGSTTLGDIQEDLVLAIQKEYEAGSPPTPILWKPANIWSRRRLEDPLTKNEMNSAIQNLLTDHLDHKPTDQGWLDLLRTYISPRFKVPKTFGNPHFVEGELVKIPPLVQTTIDAIILTFFNQHQAALNQKVVKAVQLCRGIPTKGLTLASDIKLDQEYIDKCRRDIEEDYGRCAETYCAYSVSKLFYPGTLETITDGPRILGFAMETRRIGQGAAESKVFNTSFDTNTLDSLSKGPKETVFRLPCKDFCQAMIQVVQMRDTAQKQKDYNADLIAVQPQHISAW